MQHRDRLLRGPLTGILVAAFVLASCSAAGGTGSGSPSDAPMRSAAASSPPAASTSPSDAASDAPPASSTPLSSDPLHALVLTDVRTGEEISIGALASDKPLLLETMAIWCSNCRAQQSNVVAAHNQADFHSISLDVDPGEKPGDLAAYSEQQGFDWHFAMASAELLGQLRERFGTAVAVPPGMPKILFRTDGSIEMIGLGELYTAQQIADAVGA
jgi:hypothetical protein